ncbi:MAG: hypothetical protein K8R23_19670 [Chthoniobacter sp.]|nr:hypothetical protein [Chthoniobacter sp.]
MKNLLDRFLRKPPAEPASPAPTPEPPKTKAREKAPQPLAKIAVPARTVRPAWSANTGPKRQALPERSAPVEVLTLTLGDFADRIPSDLLGASHPDLSTQVSFDLASLSERIGRGDASIPAVELAQRMPGMFRENAVIAPDRVVLFPWKKVHSIITQAREGATALGLTQTGAETLSLKVRARKIRQPSKLASARKEPSLQGGAAPQKPAEVNAFSLSEKLTLPDPAAVPEAGSPPPPHAAQNTTPSPITTPFSPEAQQRLATLTQDHEAAIAALAPLHEELVALREQGATARREFSTLLDKLALLEKQQVESTAANAALTAERDAAIARATALAAEKTAPVNNVPLVADADDPRIATLATERDAALAQAAKAVADNEAALALATEQSAERDAAVARQKELTAERDAALTRAEALAAEHEATGLRAAELGGEIAAAVSRAAELARDLESALASNTELTKERDTARARVVELEAARLSAPTALPATAPANADADTQIEGYRNTIKSLYAERDALRAEQQQLIARLAAAGVIVDKKTFDATGEKNPVGDAYVTLFPNRGNTSPLVVALLMVLLAYGIYAVSKTDLTRTVGSVPTSTAAPARLPEPVATDSEVADEVTTESFLSDRELVPVATAEDAAATQPTLPTLDPNDALPGESPVE